MKITITIDDRTGNAIKDFCKANNVKQNDYLTNIIEKQFNIDRFGDMNEMIKPKPQKQIMKKVEMTEVRVESDKEPKEENNSIQQKSISLENNDNKPKKRTLKTK